MVTIHDARHKQVNVGIEKEIGRRPTAKKNKRDLQRKRFKLSMLFNFEPRMNINDCRFDVPREHSTDELVDNETEKYYEINCFLKTITISPRTKLTGLSFFFFSPFVDDAVDEEELEFTDSNIAVTSAFDKMNLPDALLRGIYACERSRAKQHQSAHISLCL